MTYAVSTKYVPALAMARQPRRTNQRNVEEGLSAFAGAGAAFRCFSCNPSFLPLSFFMGVLSTKDSFSSRLLDADQPVLIARASLARPSTGIIGRSPGVVTGR